jgi:hypothetical protein
LEKVEVILPVLLWFLQSPRDVLYWIRLTRLWEDLCDSASFRGEILSLNRNW